jgi:hypothetical protein
LSSEDKAAMRRLATDSPYFDEDVHQTREPNLAELTDERRELTLRVYIDSWANDSIGTATASRFAGVCNLLFGTEYADTAFYEDLPLRATSAATWTPIIK